MSRTHPRQDSPSRWGVALIVTHKADELRALATRTSLAAAAQLFGHDRRTVGRANGSRHSGATDGATARSSSAFSRGFVRGRVTRATCR